jgi:hypothetical protein
MDTTDNCTNLLVTDELFELIIRHLQGLPSAPTVNLFQNASPLCTIPEQNVSDYVVVS